MDTQTSSDARSCELESSGSDVADISILSRNRTAPCAACYARNACLFHDAGKPQDDACPRPGGQVFRAGQTIYTQGDTARALYRVRAGSVKTDTTDVYGTQQVQGFYFGGDLFGFDAFAGTHRTCSAVALEDTSLCSLPLSRLESGLFNDTNRLRHLLAAVAEDYAEQLNLRMLLNHSTALQRVAAFLLNLAERLGSRSLSDTELHLGMSRNDIASYLGTAPETVSRALSKLTGAGLVTVAGKHIRINDHARLAAYAELAPDPDSTLRRYQA